MPTPRVVVVTGSSSGIGAATAAALRAGGDLVIGVDRAEAEVCVDLATTTGRAALVVEVDRLAGGRVDAVIACAGVITGNPVAVNYFGMVATLEGLRPLLARSGAPRAVGVASWVSVVATNEEVIELCLTGDEEAATTRGGGDYAASKAALCRWVRRHAPTEAWAGAGIPLNAVAPGTVTTPMVAPYLTSPDAIASIDRRVPMPLNGHASAEQVAPLLLHLTSPANTHVTGQVVFLDGGAEALIRGDSVW